MITRKQSKRGFSLAYCTVTMVGMLGFASLAVDFGRVQVAKTQLRAAVDASARHAASQLSTSPAAAYQGAIAVAAQNKVDGTSLVLQNSDIEIGTWDTKTRKFTALTGPNQAYGNAVRVRGNRTAARGTAIPTIFGQVIGQKSCDIKNVEAVAMLSAPKVINYDVPATASPYLAGMPSGTMSSPNNPHNSPDYAPFQSPVEITELNFKPGEAFSLENISGGANNDLRWSDRYNPDGNLSWMTRNDTATNSGELGKSDMYAPINALVGVFLTDEDPRKSVTPEALDFRTEASRDFSELRPKNGQVFFIGDGKRADGTPQKFVAPKGATRFYLANWDGYEWNNNVGVRTTRVTKLGSVVTVK